jgi:hypothetical protein
MSVTKQIGDRFGDVGTHQPVVAAMADAHILPDLKALIERFRPKGMALPVVVVTLPPLFSTTWT